MGNRLGNLNRRVGAWMLRAGLTRKQLAMLCGALAAASLVPLVLIALYNYPADDDFAFTLPAATAWLQTHSLWAALQAVVQKTVEAGWALTAVGCPDAPQAAAAASRFSEAMSMTKRYLTSERSMRSNA